MERIAPAGDVYQAGTLSGNPLAVSAGLKTLELLTETAYANLARTTELLAEGLRDAIRVGGYFGRAHVVSVPGLLTVFFRRDRVKDYAGAADCDREAYGAWCRELLAHGVYPPASQFEAWFPSLAHDEAAVERTVEAATAAFAAIQDRA